MALTENLALFFADFGVPCSVGAINFTAIFDLPDDTWSAAGVNVQGTGYLLQARTSDIVAASITSGTNVTVNGTVYVVRDVMLIDDGAVTHLTLSK